jgi:acyl-CoA hydrolase
VPAAEPPLELPARSAGPIERAISEHVSRLIPDRATIELGLGAVPEAVTHALGGKRGLGVHSGAIGDAAKLERRRILERTARGRADAKANGVKFGRKPILTPHQQNEARMRLEAGEMQRSVARSYNVSQSIASCQGHAFAPQAGKSCVRARLGARTRNGPCFLTVAVDR